MAHIGLFGGTFNPIHCGHLAVARHLRQGFPLDRIYLIPSHVPPHKSRSDLASAAHRVAMIELALAEVKGEALSWSDVELRREGPSYTVDTVAAFRKLCGPGDDLFLIMGADAYLELDTWCRWRALLGQVSLIVMSRPGSLADLGDKAAGDWEHLATFARDHLDGRYRLQADPWRLEHPLWSSIHFTRVPAWDLSSRQIRRRLKAGRSVEGLVPEPVAAYIASKGLYQ